MNQLSAEFNFQVKFIIKFYIWPYLDGSFLGCSWMRGGGGKKGPLSLKLVTHLTNDETWHSYTLPKEDPKNIWITWHTLWVFLLVPACFHRKSAYFAISRYKDVGCILYIISNCFNLFWVFNKHFFINIVTILIM